MKRPGLSRRHSLEPPGAVRRYEYFGTGHQAALAHRPHEPRITGQRQNGDRGIHWDAVDRAAGEHSAHLVALRAHNWSVSTQSRDSLLAWV
jgi:hypothetical protein